MYPFSSPVHSLRSLFFITFFSCGVIFRHTGTKKAGILALYQSMTDIFGSHLFKNPAKL